MTSILAVSVPVAEMDRDNQCAAATRAIRDACCTDLINVLIQYELCWQISACASCHDFENTHLLIGLQDWGLI